MEEGEKKYIDIIRHLRAISQTDDQIFNTLMEQGCPGDRAHALIAESNKELERDKVANVIVKHNMKLFLLAIIVVLVFIAVFAKELFKAYFPVVFAISIVCLTFAGILRLFVLLYASKYDFAHKPTPTDDLLFGTIIGVMAFVIIKMPLIAYIICLAIICLFVLITAYRMIPVEAILEIIIIVMMAILFQAVMPRAIEVFTLLISII